MFEDLQVNRQEKKQRRRCMYFFDFVKKYKALSVIFVVSFGITIKNSKLPFLFPNNKFLETLFLRPRTPGLASYANEIVFSFLVSVIFFYIVTFLPNKYRCARVMDIIEPMMLEVYLFLDYFVEIANNIKIHQKAESNDEVKFTSETLHVKVYRNDVFSHIEEVTANEGFFRAGNLIIESCEKTIMIPDYCCAEDDLVEAISKIMMCNDLRYTFAGRRPLAGKMKCDFLLQNMGDVPVSYFEMEATVELLKEAREVIKSFYDFPKMKYEIVWQ